MLIGELFVINPNWKQPKYPSKGEQVNCGTSIMWNGLLINAILWVNLQRSIINEQN